jgi:hypothetical protein
MGSYKGFVEYASLEDRFFEYMDYVAEGFLFLAKVPVVVLSVLLSPLALLGWLKEKWEER